VRTTSYQNPDVGLMFETKGGERYTIREIPPREVGTEVELTLKDVYRELADPTRISRLLTRYCLLLPFSVHEGSAASPPVNDTPPWRDPELGGVLRDKAALEFAAQFEPIFEPLAAFPIMAEEDDADELQGLIWVQDGATYGNADNRVVWVYVRGMQVSSDARELLPSWASFCGAIIESTALTPTASREDLQRDRAYHRIEQRLRDALVEALAQTARNKPAVWRRIRRRHNEALLGACIAEPRLFELLSDELTVPTSEGDLTLPEIRLRGKNKIHVMQDDRGGYEDVLFRATMVPVVLGNRYGALPFCRIYTEQKGGEMVQLGTAEGERAMFPPADVEEPIRRRLEALLVAENTALVLTRYKPLHLPVVLVPDREVELKHRIESDEADRRIGNALLGLARIHTETIDGTVAARLYVNMDSPIVERLIALPEARQETLARILRSLAALVSRRGATPDSDVNSTLEEFTGAIEALLGDLD